MGPWKTLSPLQRGDTVRVIAPAGVVARDRFDAGLALLKAAGLNPVFDPALFSEHGYFAGDDARRWAELDAALSDPQARAIWAARGGYGATHLLPRLDTARLVQARKWLVGFSDVSALHAVWAQAHLPSVHGANVTNIATWSEAARAELFGWLFGTARPKLRGTPVVGGKARGVVLGGNLTVLAAMAGTGYLPSWDGALVFFEDVSERPYRLDRALTQLMQSGALRGARGIILGQFTDCAVPSPEAWTPAQAMMSVLQPLGVPVLAEVPVGHENTSQVLPLGSVAHLDATAGTLQFDGADE